MSTDKARQEAQRWLDTSRKDLEAARVLMESRMYSHSCFFSQQAGGKAVKALWYLSGEDPWGHSIQKLIAEIPDPAVHEQLSALLEAGPS